MEIRMPETRGAGNESRVTSERESSSERRVLLRREAGKALSGRVPVVLSIAIVLLSGVLIGYGARSFVAPTEPARLIIPRCRPARILVPATSDRGHAPRPKSPQIQLLKTYTAQLPAEPRGPVESRVGRGE
jgi:hypothetical protein